MGNGHSNNPRFLDLMVSQAGKHSTEGSSAMSNHQVCVVLNGSYTKHVGACVRVNIEKLFPSSTRSVTVATSEVNKRELRLYLTSIPRSRYSSVNVTAERYDH